MVSHTWTRQCYPTNINIYLLCEDAGCSLEDLPGVMDVMVRENQGTSYCQHDNDDADDTLYYIIL